MDPWSVIKIDVYVCMVCVCVCVCVCVRAYVRVYVGMKTDIKTLQFNIEKMKREKL
jgi:hypothetical protein